MPKVKDLQGDHIAVVHLTGQATAGTPDEFVGFVAPFPCEITKVTLVPKAAITANGTNFFTLNARNRGTGGAGSAVAAARAWSSGNSVAFDPEDMTLDATVANRQLAEGEHLSFERTVSGTGLAMPAMTAQVHYKAR